MKGFFKYNLPSFIWAAFILWLSLTSGSGLPKVSIPNFDKIVHVGFYVVFAVLMFYGWTKQSSFLSLHQHRFIKIFVLLFIYGLAIEIMQELFTVSRYFDVLDVAANSAGVAIGSLISVKLFK